MRQLKAQNGRCASCGGLLLDADHPPTSPQEWEQWLAVTRKAITKQAITEDGQGAPDDHGARLIHTSCLRRSAAGSPHLQLPVVPQGPA
jgi:RNA-directed DNA polymerase